MPYEGRMGRIFFAELLGIAAKQMARDRKNMPPFENMLAKSYNELVFGQKVFSPSHFEDS